MATTARCVRCGATRDTDDMRAVHGVIQGSVELTDWACEEHFPPNEDET